MCLCGGASGDHIPLLSSMFPAMTFHLYDPAKFSIKETDRIVIFNDLFTDESVNKYKGRNDVFFISDIRSVDRMKILKDL